MPSPLRCHGGGGRRARDDKRHRVCDPHPAGLRQAAGGQRSAWPVKPASEPHPPTSPGPGKVVVVSTTGDPATPYQVGVDVAAQLGAPLITYEGARHTVTLRGVSAWTVPWRSSSSTSYCPRLACAAEASRVCRSVGVSPRGCSRRAAGCSWVRRTPRCPRDRSRGRPRSSCSRRTGRRDRMRTC